VRIVYVTETFPPEVNGVALTAARALNHLRAAGHAVQLMRPRQRGEPPRCDAHEWRTAGGPIPMYPELRYGWATAGSLRRAWQRDPPDLVHVTTPGPLAWAALRAARAEGIACSADYRTHFPAYSHHYRLGWLAPLVLAGLRRMHALADLNFVPTPALAQTLSAQGFERLRVLGRGVDAAHFAPTRRDPALRLAWGAGSSHPVMLYVGRLAPEKNVGLALRCFERLRRKHAALRMVVVGDGPQRAALERDHPRARFVGMQRGEALARHYASSDVFVFPSMTDTFGNVTLEALASGLAVAAYDTAAAAQHVVDGRSGCLARPGDEAAFHAATERALARSAVHGAMRRAAREAALVADWDPVLRELEQALHTLVTGQAVRRLRDAALA
jgi:glycosyltransferase involved in cell wall biosynthesis